VRSADNRFDDQAAETDRHQCGDAHDIKDLVRAGELDDRGTSIAK